MPVSGGATIHYARCRANSAFSFNARVLFVLLGTRLYACYSRPVCCVQWGCMLCTVGLYVVYSRAVCCVQWTCMLCTVGLCVVYSRAVCCVQ